MRKDTYRVPSSSTSTTIWPERREMDGIHSRTADDFVATLGRLGLSPDDTVVVYDDQGGAVAARMWWMLESIGHPGQVSGPRRRSSGLDRPRLPHRHRLGHAGAGCIPCGSRVHRRCTTRRTAREIPRRPPVTGAVPGRDRADRPQGRTHPRCGELSLSQAISTADDSGRAENWTRLYRDFPDDGIVSCGSGVNACHGALALVIAGRPMPDVYIGSFSDWSRRDLPVATGPNP